MEATTTTQLPPSDEVASRGRRVTIGTFSVSVSVLASVGGLVLLLILLYVFGGGTAWFELDRTAKEGTKFDWAYFWSLLPNFLRALWFTVQATIGGFAIAIVLGFFLALGRRSVQRAVRWPTVLFIEFVRSTPLLIQLFFLFFALPRIGWVPEPIRVLSPLTTLIIGLGIHYGTYCSEAYRAGINSVPDGQWEACTALNLRSSVSWTRVVLPQAIPNVLPALGNYLVAGFKDAPLGSAIGVTEVLFFARYVTSAHVRPVEAYTMVGLGFLAVSIPSAYLIRRFERRYAYERTG